MLSASLNKTFPSFLITRIMVTMRVVLSRQPVLYDRYIKVGGMSRSALFVCSAYEKVLTKDPVYYY